jgi:GH35 family endo-1,4-beta-xylanase
VAGPIDYQIMDSSINLKALQDQASAYSNILKVLLSKRKNGVVTFNTWGMIDKNTGKHHDKFRFIFDKNSNPKPAYFALREAVVKPDEKLILK